MKQRNNKVVASATNGLKQSYQHLGNRLPSQGIWNYCIAFLSKSITALRANWHRRYTEGDSSPWSAAWSRPVAWMPIAILLLVGLILLRKDFNLNINLTAPQGNAAPAGWQDVGLAKPAHWTPDDQEQVRVVTFVREHIPLAAEMKEVYGVPISIQFAAIMAATDGAASPLLKTQHNPFGITCHAKDCPKGHCTHLQDGPHKAFYRNYDAVRDGWTAFCTLVTTGKYRDIKPKAQNIQDWVRLLDQEGYWKAQATSAAAIQRWIDKYHLAAFDGE